VCVFVCVCVCGVCVFVCVCVCGVCVVCMCVCMWCVCVCVCVCLYGKQVRANKACQQFFLECQRPFVCALPDSLRDSPSWKANSGVFGHNFFAFYEIYMFIAVLKTVLHRSLL